MDASLDFEGLPEIVTSEEAKALLFKGLLVVVFFL
jgi:hypothetical protein